MVAAWINADSIGEGGAARIVDKRTSSNTGWQLFITDSSGSPVIAFQADHASTDMDRRTAVGLVSFDQWIHVIYSWNGTTSGGVYYINGRLAGTSLSTSGSGAYVSDASVDLYIGNRSGGDRTFDGQIDDVRIFNYPVTAAQAKVLYNQSSAVLFAPLTGTP